MRRVIYFVRNPMTFIGIVAITLGGSVGAYASGSSPLQVAQDFMQPLLGVHPTSAAVRPEAPRGETTPVAKPPPVFKKSTATSSSVVTKRAPRPTLPSTVVAAHLPPPPPKFEVAIQEDAAMVFDNDPKRAEAARELATGLTATWARTIVYPEKLQAPPGSPIHVEWQQYLDEIDGNRGKNISTEVTISCNKQVWTPESFAAFVTQTVHMFQDRVTRYSICNEPNLPGWLTPSPGMNVPDTYCMLWNAAYPVLQGKQVLIGELSSANDPIAFMNQVMRLDGPCARLTADGFAFHPYGKVANDPTGIGRLQTINSWLEDAGTNGTLTKPSGGRLDIYLTEYGWQRQDRGHRKGFPDRSNLLVQDLNTLCATPHVAQIVMYQLIRSPPKPIWQGDWDTSIADLALQPDGHYIGLPDPAYNVIQGWMRSHPPCAIGV